MSKFIFRILRILSLPEYQRIRFSAIVQKVPVILIFLRIRFSESFRVFRKTIIYILIFQFFTIPLYPSLTISRVYALSDYEQCMSEPGMGAENCNRLYGNPVAPAPYYDPAPFQQTPEGEIIPPSQPVPYKPPARPAYVPPAQKPYYPPPDEEYYPPAQETVDETYYLPPADTEPAAPQEPASPGELSTYQTCVEANPNSEVCDRIFSGGGEPASGQPAEEVPASVDSGNWWDAPAQWGSRAWEWIQDTAIETGRTIEEVVEDSGDYIASMFGGDEQPASTADEAASIPAVPSGPKPQNPEWAAKIAQADADWKNYLATALADNPDPEAAAAMRALTINELGLPADSTDDQVLTFISQKLAPEGVAVSGSPEDITVDATCALDPDCTPETAAVTPPTLAARAAGTASEGCDPQKALRYLENGGAVLDLTCRPEVTDTQALLDLKTDANQTLAAIHQAKSKETTDTVLGISADFLACNALPIPGFSQFTEIFFEKCKKADETIANLGTEIGSSMIASSTSRQKYYGTPAHSQNCELWEQGIYNFPHADAGCELDVRTNAEREKALRDAINPDSTSAPNIGEGLRGAGLPAVGWRTRKIEDLATSLKFDLDNPNADPSKRDNFIAQLIASDPEASAVIIENVLGVPLTAIQSEAIARKICDRDVGREICSLAIYDPQSRIEQEVRPRAAYLGLSEEEIAGLNADAKGLFPDFQPAEGEKVKQYAQARYEAFAAFRGNDDYNVESRKQRIAQIMGMDINDPELASIEQTYQVWNATADQILAQSSAGEVYGKAKQDTQTQVVIGMAGLALDGPDFIGLGVAGFMIAKRALPKLIGRNGIKNEADALAYIAERGGRVGDPAEIDRIRLAQGQARPDSAPEPAGPAPVIPERVADGGTPSIADQPERAGVGQSSDSTPDLTPGSGAEAKPPEPVTEPPAPVQTVWEQIEETAADAWRRVTGEEPAVREPDVPAVGDDLAVRTDAPETGRVEPEPQAGKPAEGLVEEPIFRDPCAVSLLPKQLNIIKEAKAQAKTPCTPEQITALQAKNQEAEASVAQLKAKIDEGYAGIEPIYQEIDEIRDKIFVYENTQVRRLGRPRAEVRRDPEYRGLVGELDQASGRAGEAAQQTVYSHKDDYLKAKEQAAHARDELEAGLASRGEPPLGYTDPEIKVKTEQFLAEEGLRDDDIVFRTVDTQYVKDGYITGVIDPHAQLRDVYRDNNPFSAWEMEGLGLNVLKKKSIDGGYASPGPGQVLVGIRVGDLKAAGAKVYPDIGSMSGANALMFEISGTKIKAARVYDNPVKSAYYDGMDWLKKSTDGIAERLGFGRNEPTITQFDELASGPETPSGIGRIEPDAQTERVDPEPTAPKDEPPLPPCPLSYVPGGFSFIKDAYAQGAPCPTRFQIEQANKVFDEILEKGDANQGKGYGNGIGVTFDQFKTTDDGVGGRTFTIGIFDDPALSLKPSRRSPDIEKLTPDTVSSLPEGQHYNFVVTSDKEIYIVPRNKETEAEIAEHGKKHQQLAGEIWQVQEDTSALRPNIGIVLAGEAKVHNGQLVVDLRSGTMFKKSLANINQNIWDSTDVSNLVRLENIFEGILGQRPLAVRRANPTANAHQATFNADIEAAKQRYEAAAAANSNSGAAVPVSGSSSVLPLPRIPQVDNPTLTGLTSEQSAYGLMLQKQKYWEDLYYEIFDNPAISQAQKDAWLLGRTKEELEIVIEQANTVRVNAAKALSADERKAVENQVGIETRSVPQPNLIQKTISSGWNWWRTDPKAPVMLGLGTVAVGLTGAFVAAIYNIWARNNPLPASTPPQSGSSASNRAGETTEPGGNEAAVDLPDPGTNPAEERVPVPVAVPPAPVQGPAQPPAPAAPTEEQLQARREAQAALILQRKGQAALEYEGGDCEGSESIYVKKYYDGSVQKLAGYGKIPGECGNTPISEPLECKISDLTFGAVFQETVLETYNQCGGTAGLEDKPVGKSYEVKKIYNCSANKILFKVTKEWDAPVTCKQQINSSQIKEYDPMSTQRVQCESSYECKDYQSDGVTYDMVCGGAPKRCVLNAQKQVFDKNTQKNEYDYCIYLSANKQEQQLSRTECYQGAGDLKGKKITVWAVPEGNNCAFWTYVYPAEASCK